MVTDESGSLVWGPAVLAASHKWGPTATARLAAEASPEASSPSAAAPVLSHDPPGYRCPLLFRQLLPGDDGFQPIPRLAGGYGCCRAHQLHQTGRYVPVSRVG